MNRQVFPSSLFPLRGDISAESGATSVIVQGIQGIPVVAPPIEPTGLDTLFYDSYNNDWFYASPWDIPVGTPLVWEGYGYGSSGISWIAPDTLAFGNGTDGDVSGAAAMTALVLFGSASYYGPYNDYDVDYGPSYDQFYTSVFSGATQNWNLILPPNPGTSGQVLTTNGTGVTYWSTVSGGGGNAWATLTGDLTETQVIPFDGGTVGTPDTGISRIGAAYLAIGDGTAGDYSGGLQTASLKTSSVFIDPTTVLVFANPGAATNNPLPSATAPFLPAGTYVIKVAVTDGAGNWSNFASKTFTADGSHNYALTWLLPAAEWSTGPTADGIFWNNANVYAFVSFNGGTFLHISSTSGNSFSFYNFSNLEVLIGGGYTTDSVAVPTNLNTLPMVNVTTDGPTTVFSGAVLRAPQVDYLQISQYSGLGGTLVVQGAGQFGAFLFSPETAGGRLSFEQEGIGTGQVEFNAGGVTGVIRFDCGNNGSIYTGSLNLNLGTSGYTMNIAMGGSWTLILPSNPGMAGQTLHTDGTGRTYWA